VVVRTRFGNCQSSAIWKSLGREKKGNVFGILAKNLIKLNDGHALNKTFLFLVVRNELLFPLKTHFTEEGDITFAH
jgi:hypothetical protein